ncbi:membrane protein insertase YidC [Herbaspirillum robiniae]|uniref:Membrane protein insertase YidC n=1 Tax=Herbaspirillum robiniae TaxID=2014887 RepID=A0A246WNU6_9BURK|nr:membrane protein insertase YidC [Herbaspirillum robiniae]NUU03566.1 membrane protein insertase YidC [Herbaspirillum robiniae]OWY28044.1 membrane protein insertase YidC [Herbaspirillum robiniae]
MDIKRTVLWVVFSFSLLLLWDSWMRHNGHQSMFFPSANQTQEQAAANPAAPAASPTGSPVPQAGTAAPASAAAVPAAGAAAAKGETITITTDVVKADFDTVGGELKRLELLNQRDVVDPTKNLVLFDSAAGHTYLAESGLIGGAFPNHKTLFAAESGPRTLSNGDTVQLVFNAEQDGVKLTKTFTFKRGSYLIDVKHTVTNTTAAAINPTLYLQLVRDGNKPGGESHFYSTFTGPAVYTEAEKFEKLDFEKIATGKQEHVKKADNGWIAMVQHYFVSAIIPPQQAQRDIYAEQVSPNLYRVGVKLPLGTIAPNASLTSDAQLYSGPTVNKTLEAIAPGLDLVRDYGHLAIIAKPIFWLMTHIHAVVGNWGWTIILLTVLIKLVFFPLSAASYRSMAKMKAVAPRMQAIRERHKGDPQAMNREMMAMYKTEKINPLGGCLPIAIQIPVFIALYSALLASVEMRGAPWLGWIHDLTAPDTLFGTIPYFNMPIGLLPIIMAASMFLQTKLNPTPPDPVQAKVMMFMPLVFSFMFFFFPSGLVLYWVTNNILSIAQQWVITKNIESGKTK